MGDFDLSQFFKSLPPTGAEATQRHAFHSGWGDTTDPSSHNPASFRYLVHGINPFAKISFTLFDLTAAQDGEHLDPEVRNRKQINLFDTPERVAERPSLSMSLIDEAHRGTWGDGGLLLSVPAENVLLTCNQDCGSPRGNMVRLRERASEEKPLSPNELLQVSVEFRYNEVVAEGETLAGKVELVGFFSKSVGGQPIDKTLHRQFANHAFRLGLPLVLLEEPTQYRRADLAETEQGIFFNLNGKRVFLYDDPSEFPITINRHPSLPSQFPSPAEIEEISAFLDSNISLGTATHTRARKIIDQGDRPALRSKDPEKELRLALWENGEEVVYTLYESGIAQRVRMEPYREAHTESMLSGSLPQLREGYAEHLRKLGLEPISPETLERVWNLHKHSIPDEQRAVIENLMERTRPQAEAKYAENIRQLQMGRTRSHLG